MQSDNPFKLRRWAGSSRVTRARPRDPETGGQFVIGLTYGRYKHHRKRSDIHDAEDRHSGQWDRGDQVPIETLVRRSDGETHVTTNYRYES